MTGKTLTAYTVVETDFEQHAFRVEVAIRSDGHYGYLKWIDGIPQPNPVYPEQGLVWGCFARAKDALKYGVVSCETDIEEMEGLA